MRVLHLISSGGMYGAEAVILNLSAELNAAGQRSVVGVFSHEGQPVPALYEAGLRRGIESHLVPCAGQIDRGVPGKLRALVRETGADVVHAHGYKADIYSFFALRTERPALVSTCHTWYDNDLAVRVYGAADRWVLRSFDRVVAVSPEVRDRLLKAGVSPKKIRLIRNGIATQPFEAAFAGRQEGSEKGRLRVGLVGRLAPEKGVDVYLRAAARLAQAFPEVSFVVAGDGPDRAALQALVAEIGLEGRAQLLGGQSDMPGFYQSIDVLVSASRQEGLPVALLEGMASGLPVLATAVGAVPEVVMDGETGLLVAPEDPVALASALVRLLRDPQLRARLGAAGRRRITGEFSADRMATEYLQAYRGALEACGRAESVTEKIGAGC